jgi:hypothetical protein
MPPQQRNMNNTNNEAPSNSDDDEGNEPSSDGTTTTLRRIISNAAISVNQNERPNYNGYEYKVRKSSLIGYVISCRCCCVLLLVDCYLLFDGDGDFRTEPQ